MTRARDIANFGDGIATADIGDGQVTDAKIDGMSSSKLSGALPAIDGSALTGLSGGITQSDTWRLTTTLGNTANAVISANLERADTDGAGIVGTGVSESSGVFTFPETGIWFITATGYWFGDGGSTLYNGIDIETSVDGTNFDTAASGYEYLVNGSYGNTRVSFMFDVTNTTTHKVRFSRTCQNSNYGDLIGSTANNGSWFEFIRLGDT